MNAGLEHTRESLQGHKLLPLFDKIVKTLDTMIDTRREYEEWALKLTDTIGLPEGMEGDLEDMKSTDLDAEYRQRANLIIISFQVLIAAPPDKEEWATEQITAKMDEALETWNDTIDMLSPQIAMAKLTIMAVEGERFEVDELPNGGPANNPELEKKSPFEAAKRRMRGDIKPEDLN